jgi:hypothetical protein
VSATPAEPVEILPEPVEILPVGSKPLPLTLVGDAGAACDGDSCAI